MDAVRRIAQTVLYEGHVLWPYRRSALKNHERWTFGRVYPQGREAEGASTLELQVLVEAEAAARVSVALRFLQLVERQVLRGGVPVDALEVDGRPYLTWQDATEREIVVTDLALGAPPRRRPFALPAGADEETLLDAHGARVGALLRTWRSLRGALTLAAEPRAPGLWRVTVHVANTTPASGAGTRGLDAALLSTHLVLTSAGGRFVSAQDPPDAWRAEAAACRSAGTWPVLVGEPGERGTVLGAPIILYDYPQVAPESPGDFFDACEIDELLVLNVLGLTDDERREMVASDPRAREIVERCAELSVDEVMRLHGALRERRALGGA